MWQSATVAEATIQRIRPRATGAGSRRGPVAIRASIVVALVLVAAAIHVRRPATFCLLRATTGVPCPFCGGTTAAVDLGKGHVPAAFAASPIAPLMLAGWPVLDAVRAPSWAPAWSRRRAVRVGALLAVLALAEIWQLYRFGWIGG